MSHYKQLWLQYLFRNSFMYFWLTFFFKLIDFISFIFLLQQCLSKNQDVFF